MKGWIAAVLLVTFLSGGMTGVFLGRATAPPPESKTWIDNYVDELRRSGVTEEEDLREAREILEAHEERVTALKKQVEALLEDQLRMFRAETERRIVQIRERHGKSE